MGLSPRWKYLYICKYIYICTYIRLRKPEKKKKKHKLHPTLRWVCYLWWFLFAVVHGPLCLLLAFWSYRCHNIQPFAGASRNAMSGSGKVLRYCWNKKTSCIFWNLKQSRMQRRRILFPLSNLMLPSATLNSLGGVASFNFDKNNRKCQPMLNEKYFEAILQVPFILIEKHPEDFQGEKPMDFPPSI